MLPTAFLFRCAPFCGPYPSPCATRPTTGARWQSTVASWTRKSQVCVEGYVPARTSIGLTVLQSRTRRTASHPPAPHSHTHQAPVLRVSSAPGLRTTKSFHAGGTRLPRTRTFVSAMPSEDPDTSPGSPMVQTTAPVTSSPLRVATLPTEHTRETTTTGGTASGAAWGGGGEGAGFGCFCALVGVDGGIAQNAFWIPGTVVFEKPNRSSFTFTSHARPD